MSYVVASFSGGKDSTAMVLHMIELGEQLDEVITCDTGMEFPQMYEHIEKVRRIIEGAGIKYTTLRADKPSRTTCSTNRYPTRPIRKERAGP